MRISEKDLVVLAAKNPALQNILKSMKTSTKDNKYGNVKIYEYPDGYVTEGKKVEGHGKPTVYASKKEYDRWCELLMLERAKAISNLKKQQEIIINDKGTYNGKTIQKVVYKADFTYIRDGKQVVEDVKGIDRRTGKPRTTKDFNLKWKMLKLKYPHILFEIY